MSDKKNKIIKIGESIRKRRKALGIALKKLAKDSGVSAALISQLENGLRENIPKKSTLQKLEKMLLFESEELQNIAYSQDNFWTYISSDWKDKLRLILRKSYSMQESSIDEFIEYTEKIISGDGVLFDENDELRVFFATELFLNAGTINHLNHYVQGLLLKDWIDKPD